MKFVFPLLSFRKHGGIRALSVLMNGLSERGHKVYLIVPEDAYEDFYKLHAKVRKIFTPPRGRNPVGILRALFYLFTKAPPGDFVVVSFFPTFFPAFFQKIFKKSKLIYYVQDAEQLFYPFPFSTLALLTYLLPADATFCASSWIKKKIKKGKVLNPPVNEIFFEKNNITKRKLNHIALVFRWDRRKGPWLARKILKNPLFDKFKFFIVGQDPEVRKENVHYMGTLKSERLVRVYDNCTFFILTSKFEGFGLPPLEAMARGCIPISFTRTGPTDFIVDGENGFYVNTENELYLLLEKLLKTPQKISELSRNCILTSRQFTEEKFLKRFENSLNLQ